MPRYDFRCESCGAADERVLPLARYEDPQECKLCNGYMRRLISAPSVSPDWEPYLEENLGHEPVMVQSRQHYQSLLQDRGLRNRWGVGEEKQRWV